LNIYIRVYALNCAFGYIFEKNFLSGLMRHAFNKPKNVQYVKVYGVVRYSNALKQ